MKMWVLISLMGVMSACGKEITDNTSSELNTSLDSSECKQSMEDYSGCCSSHGGAFTCGQNIYKFSIANRLICNDKTISPTCVFK